MFRWSLVFFTIALLASAVGGSAPTESVLSTAATFTFGFAFALFAVTLVLSPLGWGRKGGSGRRAGAPDASTRFRRPPR